MSVVTQTTAAAVRRPSRAEGRTRRHRLPGSRIGYVYVLPFFVVFLAFSVYPWLDTAWVSLHDTRLSTYDQSSFIGLENYRNLFTNQFFWNAFRNTITIGIISTVPQLCMALGIAHLLNYSLRGRTFFRVAILMPYATSLAAATVIFIELFDPHLGLVNWGSARRPPAGGRLAGLEVALADRRRDDRHLALDRLQRPHLPGRHAGDQHRPLRGGRHRRRRQVGAVPPRHDPRAAAGHPLHDRGLHDRRLPAVRGAPALPQRSARRRHARAVPDPRAADVPAGVDQRPARARARPPRGRCS